MWGANLLYFGKQNDNMAYTCQNMDMGECFALFFHNLTPQ
jgi:hypothetical protein